MRLMPAYKQSRDSVKVPFFDTLVELSEERPETGAMIVQRDQSQRFLVGFMWLCLVLAAAKPTWVGAPVEQQKSGRDLMVAVDSVGLDGGHRLYPARWYVGQPTGGSQIRSGQRWHPPRI